MYQSCFLIFLISRIWKNSLIGFVHAATFWDYSVIMTVPFPPHFSCVILQICSPHQPGTPLPSPAGLWAGAACREPGGHWCPPGMPPLLLPGGTGVQDPIAVPPREGAARYQPTPRPQLVQRGKALVHTCQLSLFNRDWPNQKAKKRRVILPWVPVVCNNNKCM